eukprot:GHVT01065993.1.p1 GENE.GHVT01065993.1~~GHVT01065993.1.p1  ORF type:complete len:405 (-),score=109.37 GHVT01065993.1:756-1970(-)
MILQCYACLPGFRAPFSISACVRRRPAIQFLHVYARAPRPVFAMGVRASLVSVSACVRGRCRVEEERGRHSHQEAQQAARLRAAEEKLEKMRTDAEAKQRLPSLSAGACPSVAGRQVEEESVQAAALKIVHASEDPPLEEKKKAEGQSVAAAPGKEEQEFLEDDQTTVEILKSQRELWKRKALQMETSRDKFRLEGLDANALNFSLRAQNEELRRLLRAAATADVEEGAQAASEKHRCKTRPTNYPPAVSSLPAAAIALASTLATSACPSYSPAIHLWAARLLRATRRALLFLRSQTLKPSPSAKHRKNSGSATSSSPNLSPPSSLARRSLLGMRVLMLLYVFILHVLLLLLVIYKGYSYVDAHSAQAAQYIHNHPVAPPHAAVPPLTAANKLEALMKPGADVT